MVEAPTLQQTITFLWQSILLLTSALTFRAYLRQRTREQAEVALMFASLGLTSLIAWVAAILDFYHAQLGLVMPTWIGTVSGVAFLANPYLMVRVVKQFRKVPRWIEVATAAGLVVTEVYIIYSAATGLAFPPHDGEPTWRVLFAGTAIAVVLLYLVLAYLYAAYAFLTGAYRASGVARRRLNFAAVGTGLFGLLFLVAGASIFIPGTASIVQIVGGGVFFLAIVGFYLSFSPPRWLRRGWQLEELHDFVHVTMSRNIAERANESLLHLQQAAIRLTGATRATILEPHGDEWACAVLHESGAMDEFALPMDPSGPLALAMRSRAVTLHRGSSKEAEEAARRGLVPGATQNILAIPVVSGDRLWRLLAIPLDRIPLFIDESQQILKILADQTASALETQEYAREQEELRLRESRLAQEELRRQNLAIQEATRLKSEFLANMSHELRTPLNGIIGFADLMASGKVGELSETHQEFMGDILTSSRHLLQLINDVLDLAKVEAGKMEFKPERFDPKAVVEETLVVLKPLADRKSLKVEIARDEAVASVHLDPVRLKQIVYNFASNAIKFTPEGGAVRIRILPDGADRMRVEVEDTGVGIKAEDVPKLFHEFQQLEEGMAKQHQGTGLGLALVKRLAEAQGGTVGVHSRPGKGSTFHVTLPRVMDASTVVQLVATAGFGPSVLVVDDDDQDRAALATILSAEGYRVETAATGRNALDLIATRDYDAATIDLVLPDIHGYELIKALRAKSGSRVAVVIVTQLAKDKVRSAYPVDGIFQKPVEPAALAEALRRANVPPSLTRPILVVDDDPAIRKLMEAHLGTLGYRAQLAADGERGLSVAKRDPPALAIVDLVMPRMDGFQFIDAFRATPDGRDVPIIVWTSKDLTAEESARLRGKVQLVVYKAEGGSFELVNKLETLIKGRN